MLCTIVALRSIPEQLKVSYFVENVQFSKSKLRIGVLYHAIRKAVACGEYQCGTVRKIQAD